MLLLWAPASTLAREVKVIYFHNKILLTIYTVDCLLLVQVDKDNLDYNETSKIKFVASNDELLELLPPSSNMTSDQIDQTYRVEQLSFYSLMKVAYLLLALFYVVHHKNTSNLFRIHHYFTTRTGLKE